MDPNFSDYYYNNTNEYSNSIDNDNNNLAQTLYYYNNYSNNESNNLNFLDITQNHHPVTLLNLPDSTPRSVDVPSFVPSTNWSADATTTTGDSISPSDDNSESSDPVLKYISQMLMEENMENQPCMFHDPLALHNTEKLLYDVLSQQKQQQPHLNHESPDSGFSDSLNGGGSSTTTSTSSGGGDISLQPVSQSFGGDLTNIGDGLMGSVNDFLVQNMFRERESVLQFQRGLEEASRFLPSNNRLVIDLESSSNDFASKARSTGEDVKIVRENSPDWSRGGRKNHEREFAEADEERSHKHVAVAPRLEESELSEVFDRVLLLNKCTVDHCANTPETSQKIGQSNGGKSRKRQGKKKETVDLRTLLILCAQAVSADDRRTANELLKQIRQHSSIFGDATQRLAHFFANGLEARLAGSGPEIKHFFISLFPKKTAFDMLKAYKEYLYSCPFKKLSIFFAIKMILDEAENGKTLHIVDFGISYGFQWPMLIQHLVTISNRPSKLRITGIEFPQPGFRPAERIEETGRRLAKYCERFDVPFEYHAIASQHWETIRVEDINIKSDEVLAVSNLYRFKNLLEETVEVNCPRNAVLNLIRQMNPAIFVNSVNNGAYNAPFFITRFREALFYFSAMFDIFDATLARDNPGRLMFEKEFYGREAMNVIACEGLERVERPETYKQWQVRTMRAGFNPVALDQDLLEKFRFKLRNWYHKDFVLDQDGNWMLHGWKGRILFACSCWKPS
ncbi:hypothetical protein ACFE04_014153 [Oxalis oulophora]